MKRKHHKPIVLPKHVKDDPSHTTLYKNVDVKNAQKKDEPK